MDITEYNGGTVLAMAGDKCVAIASDLRLGEQRGTLACDWSKAFPIHDRLYCGLAGLGTDVLTLQQRLRFRHKVYELREERKMKPKTFGKFLSNLLYQGRFAPYFCEPVVAGLEEDGSAYITGMDLIGAMEDCTDFRVAGTSTQSVLGACEAFYRPNLPPDELFEVICQSMVAGLGRDCLSGWGAVVHVLSHERGTMTRTIKTRMD